MGWKRSKESKKVLNTKEIENQTDGWCYGRPWKEITFLKLDY